MYYQQFLKSLNNSIIESIHSYGNLIQKTADGLVLVNNETTEFKSLEEARTYIKTKQQSDNLEESITKEIYEDITDNRIANIIREHYNVKVTDTLIESYIELASSNIFTVDPVVQEIRKLNKLDIVVENKTHYELNDGTVVAINEATQTVLNSLLQDQNEIVQFMRESKENFFNVLERIEE
jgi:ATP-dependent 26S proteasome regulatory subunit